MTGSLIFLLCLLVVWIGLNWRMLAGRFGWTVRACDWSRIASRDRDGRQAWFCPSCGREELTDRGPPPDCGTVIRRD